MNLYRLSYKSKSLKCKKTVFQNKILRSRNITTTISYCCSNMYLHLGELQIVILLLVIIVFYDRYLPLCFHTIILLNTLSNIKTT